MPNSKEEIGKKLAEGIKNKTKRPEGWKEEMMNKIIELLTENGTTYGEAGAILKGIEFELGRRKFEEPIKKE